MKVLLRTQNTLFTMNCVTSSCLAACSVHFTLSDLDFKQMSREKGYWTAKAINALNTFRYKTCNTELHSKLIYTKSNFVYVACISTCISAIGQPIA